MRSIIRQFFCQSPYSPAGKIPPDDDHILNNTVSNNYRISMDFEITSDKRNELLSRREVRFTLRFDGATPSRMQIIGKVCAILNVKEQQVVLDSLKSSFGKMELAGVARIYDSEEGRKKTERAHLMARGMPKPKEEGAA
jgi:small subunit ribosomal protein S24e